MSAPSASPDVSVVIPSYNSRGTLLPCLRALARQTLPPDRFEVVVVLDGSTDGSERALAALRVPYALTVITQPNRGRAAALNRAAREATGTYLCVIDSDILTNPEFLEARLAAHREGDVVIGPIPLARQSPRSFMSESVGAWGAELAEELAAHPERIRPTDIFGANLSLELVAFRRLGGYREDLLRTQDLHLGIQILRAGLKVVFCRDAVAAQIYDKQIGSWYKDRYLSGRAQASLVQEFPEAWDGFELHKFYPLSLTKRLVRPLIVRRHPVGEAIVRLGEVVLEVARRCRLRGRIFSACQGVIGDSLYFRGVYEEVGDEARFLELVATPPEASGGAPSG